MTDATNVFISYASDTKPRAEELSRALESQGMTAWVDFKNLRPGHQWKAELDRAIDEAQWLIILVGTENRASAWQEAEWSSALVHAWADREKKLLPVVFGQSDPPAFLRNWVSLRIDPSAEASAWTTNVVEVLRDIRGGELAGDSAGPRTERLRRLDEVQRAAETLRQTQLNEPPPFCPRTSPD